MILNLNVSVACVLGTVSDFVIDVDCDHESEVVNAGEAEIDVFPSYHHHRVLLVVR